MRVIRVGVPTRKRTLQRNRLLFLCTIAHRWSSAFVQSVTPPSDALAPLTLRGGSVASMSTTTSQTNSSDPWASLGGGDVNEKKRQYAQGLPAAAAALEAADAPPAGETCATSYNPTQNRAHLFHSLEGMDRYPNYLSRWNMQDVDQLEGALEQQLERIRRQRQSIQERRKGIETLIQEVVQRDGHRWKALMTPPTSWEDVTKRILDPRAAKAIFGSRMFANKQAAPPTIQDVLTGKVAVELDAAKLQTLLDEEFYDVYSFRLLSTDFCKELREYVTALTELCRTEPFAHLQVGRRPVDFDSVGLSWVNDLLFHLIMRPITRHLFQSTESLDDLDWRQGYVAGYSASPTEGKPRERLVTHTDDSEVTLNVGLGDEFEGGELEFRGLRGDKEEGELVGTFLPQPGLALLHAGRQFHDVTQITSGDRFALIIWARSWKGARAQTCPCCWLNRRQDHSCVCGARWN